VPVDRGSGVIDLGVVEQARCLEPAVFTIEGNVVVGRQ
jgi:hypothetical protein